MVYSISYGFCLLHAHAGGHPEGGCDGGEYGDYDVKDLAPGFFCHFFF